MTCRSIAVRRALMPSIIMAAGVRAAENQLLNSWQLTMLMVVEENTKNK